MGTETPGDDTGGRRGAAGWAAAPATDAMPPIPFIEEAGVIFADLADAVGEYATASVEAAAMPAPFKRALVFELAARLAMPVRRDRQIRGEMIQLAELWRERAMADDLNRHPRRQAPPVSTMELARAGVAPGWWPLAAPGGRGA